jgi:hypothetical protein
VITARSILASEITARKRLRESVPIFEILPPNHVTDRQADLTILASGWWNPRHSGSAATKKRSFAMARLPPSEPLFSDDSWGLFLVPILTCIGLFISAIFWL